MANCYVSPDAFTETDSSFQSKATRRCSEKGYCQGPLWAKVGLEMTNGSNRNKKQFSYDVMGVRELYITYFTLVTVMMFWLRVVRDRLISQNKYHSTVQVLHLSIFLNWASLLFEMIHVMTFADDGKGHPWMTRVGSVLMSLSDLLVIYLLIFLAKGWTLVRYKISSGGRLKIAVLITLTLFSSMGMEVWKSYGYARAKRSGEWALS